MTKAERLYWNAEFAKADIERHRRFESEGYRRLLEALAEPIPWLRCILCRHTVREHNGMFSAEFVITCDCCSRPGSIAVRPTRAEDRVQFLSRVEGA